MLSYIQVMYTHLVTLGLGTRKIEFYEDQIVACIIFKLRFGQNLSIEFDTPAAPVRTGEIKQKKFVRRLGLFLCFLVIIQPAGLRARELPREKNRDCKYERNETIRFHVTTFDVITTRRKSGTTHRRCGNHSFTKPQIARRNNAGLSTDNRNLTQMFRDELGHLEHAHLALPIKYRP